jgi:hypothetical protein
MNDLQKTWQEQPEEAKKVSMDEIQRRARKLDTEMRWKTRAGTALGIFLCPCFAWTAARTPATIPRIGWAVLSLWSLYSIWLAYKWVWSGRSAADDTSAVSIDYYRSQLERQIDYGRHIWRRSGLTWCFVGLALVIEKALINPRLLKNAIPLFVILAIWFVAFFVLKKRNAEKLKREIDDLNALSGERK